MTPTHLRLAFTLTLFGCATAPPPGEANQDPNEPDPSGPALLMAECSEADAVTALRPPSPSPYDGAMDRELSFVSAAVEGERVTLTLRDGDDDVEIATALRPGEAQFDAGDRIRVSTGPLGLTLRDLEGRLLAHMGYGGVSRRVEGGALADDLAVDFELLCDNVAPHHVSPQFCGDVIYAQYELIVNGAAVSAGETELPASGEAPAYRVEVQRIAERRGYAHENPCADPQPEPELAFDIVALR